MITITSPEHDAEKVHTIIEQLYALREANKRVIRHKTFRINEDLVVEGWTMQNYVYKKQPGLYPIEARGLFTTRNKEGQHSIVIRGYNKFFNIDEVKSTEWESIEKKTEGPYEIQAKENGCIIFITAASPTTVVVTSKHTIPEVRDDNTRHGGVGYRWLCKHLASVQKTEEDLAAWLYGKHLTLVAELCDDDFEEHVLAYTEPERGLYLHGINHNTSMLQTLPSDAVQCVARHFGLLPTYYLTLPDLKSVKDLADEVQKTNCFGGREVEGIVVRCKRNDKDFFFKVKNQQYLLYREYREVTRAMLMRNNLQQVVFRQDKKMPRIRYEETKGYVEWLRERIHDTPEWFDNYLGSKGIIRLRLEYGNYRAKG
ncbi:hypothetical protein DFQ28_009019 [Apophysomyces sp. BC1034]|nr:hypothetical protein DFQ29_000172 [Apophysomyces sp. BC1021]KAG0168490.1 hypothetical protein DFQ30_004725 [Apophysomyces sp. BC1015]KAG0185652.1 hypothetical protein DFQ28_009019 [Apophysomyces sp. BC1034]